MVLLAGRCDTHIYTKLDSVLTVLCRNHRKCVTKITLVKNNFAGPFSGFVDDTLFMSNQILKRLFFENIDFHQKFTKIEDFKVDHSKKKLLNFPNREFLYRKSYSKFDGFWGLLINLVVFFEWSTLKPSIFLNF